jgi:hypothetical protein
MTAPVKNSSIKLRRDFSDKAYPSGTMQTYYKVMTAYAFSKERHYALAHFAIKRDPKAPMPIQGIVRYRV